MNPNEMTLDQCRDWLAEDDNPKLKPSGVPGFMRGRWEHHDLVLHPIDATLDAIAAAMPEGWNVDMTIRTGLVTAGAWETDHPRQLVHITSATSELLARARLAVACRMADKEAKR